MGNKLSKQKRRQAEQQRLMERREAIQRYWAHLNDPTHRRLEDHPHYLEIIMNHEPPDSHPPYFHHHEHPQPLRDRLPPDMCPKKREERALRAWREVTHLDPNMVLPLWPESLRVNRTSERRSRSITSMGKMIRQ